MKYRLFFVLIFIFIFFLNNNPVYAQTFGPICELTTTPGAPTCTPAATSTPVPTTPPGVSTNTPIPTTPPPTLPVAGSAETTLALLAISGIFTLGGLVSIISPQTSDN